jgi:AcrR family transcriptional regulator
MVSRADLAPPEGLRQRKRRETRARIVDRAFRLFLAQGYEAVTVEEIAAAADISKRSFFDYFPSKEDVVQAWQDAFGEALAKAVLGRPAGEPAAKAVEAALAAVVESEAADPQVFAADALVQATPTLKAREPLKYARLEEALAAALIAREGAGADPFRLRLLAMLTAGGMRLTAERGRAAGASAAMGAFVREVFAEVWADLERLAAEARA